MHGATVGKKPGLWQVHVGSMLMKQFQYLRNNAWALYTYKLVVHPAVWAACVAHLTRQAGRLAVLMGAAAELEEDWVMTKPVRVQKMAMKNFIMIIEVLRLFSKELLWDARLGFIQIVYLYAQRVTRGTKAVLSTLETHMISALDQGLWIAHFWRECVKSIAQALWYVKNQLAH